MVWYVWFRDSPHEKAGVSDAERREIGAAPGVQHHGMPWATALRMPALWRIAAIGACYVYALGFFQSWLQTYLVRGRGFTEAALVLSSLTYAVGATANGLGGFVGDWMVRRHGLRNGRRMARCRGTQRGGAVPDSGHLRAKRQPGARVPVAAYGGILFQQPTLCALCLDVGRKNAGAVFGFMNTAGNAASALSAVVFGYLVGYFGNYNTPFIPMVGLLAVGALLWLQVDPTRELFPEARADKATSAPPLVAGVALPTTRFELESADCIDGRVPQVPPPHLPARDTERPVLNREDAPLVGVAAGSAPQALHTGAQFLRRQSPFLRRLARLRRTARPRPNGGLPNERGETRPGGGAVLWLGAMFPAVEDEHAVGGHAAAGKRGQTRLDVAGSDEPATSKRNSTARGDLVDVLPARAGRPHEPLRDLALVRRQRAVVGVIHEVLNRRPDSAAQGIGVPMPCAASGTLRGRVPTRGRSPARGPFGPWPIVNVTRRLHAWS